MKRRASVIRRVLIGAAVLGSVVGVAAVTPSSWADAAPVYAALGDSYSSGTGAGPYDLDETCERSSKSAAALWAQGHPGTRFDFAACTGATTNDVLNKQLAVLREDTTHVTITIGGNDSGAIATVVGCLFSNDEACVAAITTSEAYMTSILPGQLARTYGAIRAKAPNAKLFVLGYPRGFELTQACASTSLDGYKRGLLNHGADLLNQVVATQAAAAGATFVDVRTAFDGHGICSSRPFIQAISSPVTDSFHPLPAGYSDGYLPEMVKFMG